jgi:hypothetical protein
VASCIVEGLLPGGDRTGGPFLLDLGEQAADLRTGWKIELVAAEQRLGGVVAARPLDCGRELGRTGEGERLERPRLDGTAEAVDVPART